MCGKGGNSNFKYSKTALFQIPALGADRESVSKLRYVDVSLTTAHREGCFAHSERIRTFPSVTSRNSREGTGVTAYQNLPTFVV